MVMMRTLVPDKLKKGDEIRVIAPSRSMNMISEDTIKIAKQRLEALGFYVTFGKHVFHRINEDYACASVAERVSDLHDAFVDPKVKGILTAIGGFNVNQLLDHIDFELLRQHPKIICGFSDITALLNAIYTKTGMVTYYGPHFSSFGMKQGFEYTLMYFKQMLMEKEPVVIQDADCWSDDPWYIHQDERKFIANEGRLVLNPGIAEGTIIGGNLCTLNLLLGSEYMPDVNDCILFLEDDDLSGKEFLREFDRNLQALLHHAKGKQIKGIVLGRAQIDSVMTCEKWQLMLKLKPELKHIPMMVNMDFGHTTPIFTFPIGGKAFMNEQKLILYAD